MTMVNFGITTYLVTDSSGYTKIGKSKDPSKRIRTICCGNPTARLLLLIEGDHERELHHAFKTKKVTGEWYNLSPTEIEQLSRSLTVILDNRKSKNRYSFAETFSAKTPKECNETAFF